MKKRGKIRAAVITAAAIITLCGLLANTCQQLSAAKLYLEYSYSRALNDLCTNVSKMKLTLQKSSYIGTAAMLSVTSAELLEQSSAAKAAMAVLPVSQSKTDNINRFLSQAGDHAMALSRKAAAGTEQTDADLDNLNTLEEYAEKLEIALHSLQTKASTGELSLTYIENRLDNISAEMPFSPEDHFDEVSKEFSERPSLLYDGPFSDHIAQKTPLFFVGRQEITREQAAGTAADFLDCTAEELKFNGEGGGVLRSYSFNCGDSHVNISKIGGEIVYFKKAAAVERSRLGYKEALASSAEILREMGIEAFIETGYITTDNLCTINFVATVTQNGVEIPCYPDLIKVTTELNEGGMVEYDATGYLMNRHERELYKPQLTTAQAAEGLSSRLNAQECRLAVIPAVDLNEVLCYEFLCKAADGTEYLVYINSDTGAEEQLYLLQRDEYGVRVI